MVVVLQHQIIHNQKTKKQWKQQSQNAYAQSRQVTTQHVNAAATAPERAVPAAAMDVPEFNQ
ncbi:MAG: hypothetical protein JSS82_07955 [Bacteroidetes bacterium]|nr:hypothetical protein [Bacteroidota bacterium]